MTDDPQTTPNAATPPPATGGPETAPEPKRSAGVSRGLLIGVGVAVVLLSFLASFLGASLARSNDAVEAVPTPTMAAMAASAAAAIRRERMPRPPVVRVEVTPGSGFRGAVMLSQVRDFMQSGWRSAAEGSLRWPRRAWGPRIDGSARSARTRGGPT